MSKTQIYAISVTALWAYDYFLTFKDEVTEFYNDNEVERALTTSYRSVTHGKRTAFSVREPSVLFWIVLTDDISVFVLFLFVGALRYRRHISLTVV